MLVKLGVDISRLSRECRRSLKKVDALFAALRSEAVVTSTYEGNHSPSSLHYANAAYDIRLAPDSVSGFVKLREALGKDFDVVLEGDHYHVEYDPK